MEKIEKQVTEWFDEVSNERQTNESIEHLTLALQCGGSDAFSGITANPLMGNVSHKLIQNGGAAILAETTELIGAEKYLLACCRNHNVAQDFLRYSNEFKDVLKLISYKTYKNTTKNKKIKYCCYFFSYKLRINVC